MTLVPGIYEQIISLVLNKDIKQALENGLPITTQPIDPAEAKHILTQYLTEIIEKSLPLVCEDTDEEVLKKQIIVANQIVQLLAQTTNDPKINDYLIDSTDKLTSVSESAIPLTRPETSISISTLFTGSKLEPSMMNELKKEILSCDRIDMLVSFIKWSGLRLIYNELKEFTKNHRLRIITTSYMGATDLKAIKELAKLPNTEIKISYETRTTRLHAKAYMFHRRTGFSTAYVGSSNVSRSALGTGLEWNVKLTEKDLPHVLTIIARNFESYWNDPDFEIYTDDKEEYLRRALKAEKQAPSSESPYLFEIRPYPFQQEILDKLTADRKLHNRYRNLVVAATGTGKTVVSAFDYKRLRDQNPAENNRLLFIAHRTDILKQSVNCFRGVLRDHNFGDIWDGNNKPDSIDYLFMTVQTFQSQEFQKKVPVDYYDMIIVDEFHHAAAKSYQTLLTYFKPKILLGLTATPERMDGYDVTEYFNGITSAEIRLPEAINRGLLSPFQYFCVTDPVDLSECKFVAGKYDVRELEVAYNGNTVRTRAIIDAVNRYVTDIDQVIGLGFCASRDHAKYMVDAFNAKNILSTYLDGDSSEEERRAARESLRKKEIHFIFTVNLYNEGVDIPEVNTILFLRPTESLTVFLQQLGRGLRLAEGKDVLTVLDFIGQAEKRYNFERKFRALLDKTRRSVRHEIENGFDDLPNGCFIQMERLAQKYILDNIKNSLPNKNNIVNKLRFYKAETGEVPTLRKFLETYELSVEDVYKHGLFTELCADADICAHLEYDETKEMGKAFRRFCHIDARRWITFLLKVFKEGYVPNTDEEIQMVNMMYYTFYPKSPDKFGFNTQTDFINKIKNMPEICAELIGLLELRIEEISFIDLPIDLHYPSSLDLYCSYTRDEIEAGLGWMTWAYHIGMLEGVRYIKEKQTVIMLVTLQKTEKQYSPTTMYEDYVISEDLFHWQSQSNTAEDSEVGQRYIHHEEKGIQMLLFVRPSKGSGQSTDPYRFLGRAHYVSHEGSKPMSIIWKLERKIPVWLFSELNTGNRG